MENGVKIVNALVSPGKKLIGGMFKLFGKMYEPHYLKKMADAQSYQIKKIGEAMRENSDIPIEYNHEGIKLSNTDYDEFVKRTQSRLAFQELKKQENIETIAGKALNLLEGRPDVENKEPDPDWMNRFFDAAENISNEEMQDLWASILAGEIQHPGTFSLRTIDAVRNISQSEAKIFQELSEHCLCTGLNTYAIIHDNLIMNDSNIPYGKIMLMGECGLINAGGMLSLNHDANENRQAFIWCDDYTIVSRTRQGNKNIRIPVYPLTQSGSELISIIGLPMKKEEIVTVTRKLNIKFPDMQFELHSITEKTDISISYSDEDILEEEA